MKDKQKNIAELGNNIFGIMNSKRDILFKEKAMMTVLMNFADIDNETDRKKFVYHVLNIESIKKGKEIK